MRPLLSPARAKTARRGPRFAIGAVTLAILAAFALAGWPATARAASNPGNLVLASTANPQGCALGPAFTFCDSPPGIAGPDVQFNIQAESAVTGVAVSLAAIPGLSANFANGDFLIGSNTCTGNLAANQQCQVSVAFSPTMTGLRQAAINVTDSSGDSLIVNVEGTGSQLALTPPVEPACTPAALPDNAYTYCAAIGTTTPTTETFTLVSGAATTGVNVALAPIAGLESEFAANDFTIESTSTTCSGALAPGGTCEIGIAFTPTAAGLRSAKLTATDSSGDTSTIYLAGPATSGLVFSTVSQGNGIPCGMTNPLTFCNLPEGGVSKPITLNFLNSSGTQITGLSVPTGSVIAQGATAPDFIVQSSSCTSVLPSGATCSVTVAFTPTASGLRQGAVLLTDAQGDSAAVNLAGYGDNYSIATQLPTEISVTPGSTATFTATLTPDNVLGMNGEQIMFVCPTNLPTNTSCTATPCPATITPGMPVSVKVALVTSSATVVAPIPSTGCSSYGPSVIAPSRAFLVGRPGPPISGARAASGSPPFPALLWLAALGGAGLLILGIAMLGGAPARRRVALVCACAGLTAAILAGCHHKSTAITTATPTGETNLTVLGNAVDANGNSLNTGRMFQFTLDVVTK
ncbi:MAG: choice-of-anchor D domain-containing protein [Candidatus Acidiferrales bacterium]